MNSDMVKSEKQDHVHLVYYFTIPLFSEKRFIIDVRQGLKYVSERIVND